MLKAKIEPPVHIVGIGGIGMSALAVALCNQGVQVQGSDLNLNAQTEALIKKGIKIFNTHDFRNVENAKTIVRSSAINSNNPEIIAGQENNKTILSRKELLAKILDGSYNICITGAHGKTSTTALVYEILNASTLKPNVICGGIINSINSNAHFENSDLNVVEADESDGTFLHLPTDIAIITNIDKEHLEYYGSFDNLKNAYKEFISKTLLNGGIVISNADCQYLLEINKKHSDDPKYLTYGISGLSDIDLKAHDIVQNPNGIAYKIDTSEKLNVLLKQKVEFTKEISLKMYGYHSVENSLAAMLTGLIKNIDFDDITKALKNYQGVKRRFSVIKEVSNLVMIDDYAHHPSEIKTTLVAIHQHLGNHHKLICVFQPHRYSRLKTCYNDFLDSFDNVDLLIIMDVFSSGESNIYETDSKKFLDDIKHRTKSLYINDQRKILNEILKSYPENKKYVIFMGAGDISSVAHNISKAL